ncbi:MAG: sensor histidine kinase, partial [Nostoc sp.]
FLGRALPASDDSGTIIRWYGTFTDIEEFKQLDSEREQVLDLERSSRVESERAGRIKDEFLATLSHELRTPLNAILGWAQLLSYGISSAEELENGLSTIQRNALAQSQIIDDLLDMSRIISGKLRLTLEKVS